MSYRLATILSGIALLLPTSMGFLITGYPTILHPFPAMTVLPAFFLASAHLWALSATIPVIGFLIWNPALLHGQTQVPWRSHALLAAATGLNVIWFAFGWKFGLQYQGSTYTYAVFGINVAWIAILAASIVLGRKQNSFASNLVFHWLLFAWLGWFAFPYLGELP